MSDGDRGGDNQVGLKRWLWPAIIFALVVVGAAGIQHRVHYNDASRNAANYSRDAQNQIAAECGVALADPGCAREIEQARRANQRDEYDLYAQKAMALWTGVMGGMAILGIALSGIAVYLIWRTWDATREAAENSRKTLRAYIAKERAILVLWGLRYGQIENLPCPDTFTPKLENRGDSPAKLHSIKWEFLNGPAWPEVLRCEKTANSVIPTRGEGLGEVLTSHGDDINGAILAVTVEYMTVREGPFCCHASFKITRMPADGYGGEKWTSEITYISGTPTDT